MKTLKKFSALTIALAMILTLFVGINPASAAADMSKYEASVKKLAKFGIVLGIDKVGDYQPNADVTRAQMATMIVRALGQSASAEAAKGTTKFDDVPTTHWAAGTVNVGVQLGIIKGRSSTVFDPEAKVTGIEAIAMIERAMGLERLAVDKGGWPVGYLVVGQDKSVGLEITKGVEDSLSNPAPRGLICKFLDNVLTDYFWEVKEYNRDNASTDLNVTYAKSTSTTFLTKMGYTEVKDIIVAKTPAYGTDKDKVEIAAKETKDAAQSYYAKEIDGIDNYMGKRGTAYYKEDENDSTKKYIYEITVDSNATTIDVPEATVEDGKIQVVDASGTKTKYDMWSNVLANVNFVTGKITNSAGFTTNYGIDDKKHLRDIKIVLFPDSDGTKKIDAIYGYKYNEAVKVDSVVDNTVSGELKIKYDAGTAYINKDKDNKAASYRVCKKGTDGKYSDITIDKVVENDILYIASKNAGITDAGNAKDNRVNFLVVSEIKTGAVKAFEKNNDNKVTKIDIDGTVYEMLYPISQGSLDDGKGNVVIDDKISVRMTKNGKIYSVFKGENSTSAGYAVVVNASKDADKYNAATYYAKLFKSDGSKVEYEADSDAKACLKEMFNKPAGTDGNDVINASYPTKGTLVKFELNSDGKKVLKLQRVPNGIDAPNVASLLVDTDKKKIGSNVATDDIVMYNVSAANNAWTTVAGERRYVNGDDAEVNTLSWSALDKDKNYDVAYILNSDKNKIIAARFQDVQSKKFYAVVVGQSEIADGKGRLTLAVSGEANKGAVKSYDCDAALTTNIAKGDVIGFTLTGDNKVKVASISTASSNSTSSDTRVSKVGSLAYYDIEKSGISSTQITVDSNNDNQKEVYSLASEVAICYNENFDTSKDFTSMALSDLSAYMKVAIYKDKDGNIVAIKVEKK